VNFAARGEVLIMGAMKQSAAPTNADLAMLLDKVVQLARTAGAAIMEVYRSEDFGETSKADNSPLTLADLAAHQCIVAGLARLEPLFPVLSEEDANIPYAVRSKWVQYWLVDPLDGTKEFVKRNGEFTVNIALVENGVPVLGVVYAPVLDVCYYAARGSGAFVQRGGKSAQAIKAISHTAGAAIKVVASRSHSDERTAALLQKLGEHECISMGSSLKLCLIAEAAAHFYPRLGPTMEWDTAAAHAVVNEAGGIVCDLKQQALRYNKEDLHNPEFLVLAKTNTALLKLLKD
jgi:3'(2'), 5'-bisphosphate nucleotidase